MIAARFRRPFAAGAFMVTIGTLGMPAAPASAPQPETLQMRLLRSIYTGSLQGLTAAELEAVASDRQIDFATSALAIAMRHLRGTDRRSADRPLTAQLDYALTATLATVNPPDWMSQLPPGFAADDLIYALVYALTMAGDANATIDVLGAHLGPTTVYADYKRAVVLQALRNIGTRRADELIRRAATQGKDSNVPENLLADEHFPFHAELKQRWHLIPESQRTRENLLRLARTPCSERAALATYLLGYFSPAVDETVEQAELGVLRDLTRAPCYHTRYHAVRALALRSEETLALWIERFRSERDAWQRAELVRIMFARFGRAFLQPALGLLADEQSQYVQWELMHGNLEMRDGGRFRDYWDIWQTTTLQIRLSFPEGKAAARSEDMDEILDWLETGARARDRWVQNHLLYGIAKHVSGSETRRLLRAFNRLDDKTAQWWILGPLEDAAALPLLRYWRTAAPDNSQRRELQELVDRLAKAALEQPAGDACCAPTKECLVASVAMRGALDERIQSDAQASEWLAGNAAVPAVEFLDALGHVASVTRTTSASAERWEHLFGCWRLVTNR